MNRRAAVVVALVVVLIAVGILLFARIDAERDAIAREFGVTAAAIPGATQTVATGESLVLDGGDAEYVARVRIDRSESGIVVIDDVEPDFKRAPSRRLGRVLDIEGTPVANVSVALRREPESALATSAADGFFTLDAGDLELVVVDERWYTLRDTEPLPHGGDTLVLVVVAPALRIGGRVLDPTGFGVEGASVGLDVPWSAYAGFPVPLDRGRATRTVRTQSDASGAFELVIPSAPRARLIGQKDGYREAEVAAPSEVRTDLVVTLEPRERSGDPIVRGVVVHADGTPGIGATVRYGRVAAHVDDEGRFELAIPLGDPRPIPLVAVKKDHQPAVVPEFTTVVHLASGPLPEQRLVLGGPPLAIEGAVVDHEGAPKKGWSVQPIDPIVLFEGMFPPESAESIAHGSAPKAVTDERGVFRLEGLADRAYRLQAHSKDEFGRIESEPIPAGARNARIVVPADAWWARVDGVVESADGTPIAGVEVRAALITFRSESGSMSDHADGVTTDAEGRFSLAKVPRNRGRLDAGGDAILPTTYDLETHVDGRLARIVAARRCHVRVEDVPPESNVRHVQVHDAQGQALMLMQFQSNAWMSSTQVQLQDGDSPLFAVSETARTIVFLDEDAVRTSRPLVLAPGAITVVRW